MKKVFKAIGYIAALLAIYVAAQVLVTFVIGIVHAVRYMTKIMASNTMPDVTEIAEEFLRYVGGQTPVILLFAVLITLPFYYLIYKGRKQELRSFVGAVGIHPVSVPILIVFGVALNFIVDMLLGLLSQFDFFKKFFESYGQVAEAIFGGGFVLTLIAVGIVGPIFEEILFRGLIFGELRKVSKLRLAIVLQALIFGVFHMNIVQGTYAFLIGIILGYVYYRSSSIIAPILVHIAINSSSVLLGEFVSTESLELYSGAIVAASIILIIITGAFIQTHRSFRHVMDDSLYIDNHASPPSGTAGDDAGI